VGTYPGLHHGDGGPGVFARIIPCQENGKTDFVNFLALDEVACGSTEFIVLRGRRVSNYFVYLTSRQQPFRENAIRSMIGSSGRQRVQPQHATDVGRVDNFCRGEGSVCDQSSDELCPRSMSAEPIGAVR
jgi:hypothetical protein